MHWIAPSERDTATDTLEKRLWNTADQFRANSGLKAGQYSTPVLGLIFLRFAAMPFINQFICKSDARKTRRFCRKRRKSPAKQRTKNAFRSKNTRRFRPLRNRSLPDSPGCVQARRFIASKKKSIVRIRAKSVISNGRCMARIARRIRFTICRSRKSKELGRRLKTASKF